MAIGAGLPLSYADLSAALGINWYRGGLTSSVSHTSGRYRSLKLDSVIDSNSFTPSWSGDCLTGLDGVFSVSAVVSHPANTNGYRSTILAVNPSATTVDSTSDLTYASTLGVDEIEGFAACSAVTQIIPVRVRLVSTDKLMLRTFQDSGSALTIPTTTSKVWLQIVKVGS